MLRARSQAFELALASRERDDPRPYSREVARYAVGKALRALGRADEAAAAHEQCVAWAASRRRRRRLLPRRARRGLRRARGVRTTRAYRHDGHSSSRPTTTIRRVSRASRPLWATDARSRARYLISVRSLNIGRYIEMTMVPTMAPTQIISSGSMIDVSEAMLESTSSS